MIVMKSVNINLFCANIIIIVTFLTMDNIPSISNPPNAPKKPNVRKNFRLDNIPVLNISEEEPEWRILANSGQIRQKYLRYDPGDVLEMDDIDMLEKMRTWYTPSSQPRNCYEEAYFSIMIDAVNARLYTL